MKIAAAFPFIGTFVLRTTIKKTARAARAGDIQAVRRLAAFAATVADPPSRTVAYDALRALSSQEAIDAFCMEVLVRKNPGLDTLAMEQGYVPNESGQQALFLFIMGQENALCRADTETYLPFLAEGYSTAPAEIRKRALDRAQDPRMGRLLARALMTGGNAAEPRVTTWSYEEWLVVLDSLCSEKAWDEIWPLVSSAPPGPALRALQCIRTSGHLPGGDLHQVAEELLLDLPDFWSAPAPETPAISIENQDSRCVRIAFSKDGSFLAAGNSDGSLQVWQLPSARLLFSRNTGTGSIDFLTFLSGNTGLIAGEEGGRISCMALSTGIPIWTFDDTNHRISSVVLTDTGADILGGDTAGRILFISGRTGAILRVWAGHPSPVTTLSGDPVSGIYSGHGDGTLCSLDTTTGEFHLICRGTGDPVRRIAPVHGEDQILVIHAHASPILRQLRTGTPVRTLEGYAGDPACMAVSADNRTLAIGSSEHLLRIWTLPERIPSAEIPFYNRLPACCAITPDGRLLVCGCNDGTVYYLGIPGGDRIKEFRGFRKPVSACAISQDCTLLALAGSDGTITLRSIPGGEIQRTLRRPAGAITALAAARGMILAGSADGQVRFFARRDGALIRSIDLYTPGIRALAVEGTGRYFACAGSDQTLRIWVAETGSLAASCDGLKTTIRCLTFHPDGNTLISGGWDGKVRIWSVPEGNLLRTLPGHTSNITCCCTDPTGTLLVTVSNDATVRIHHLASSWEPVVIREAKKELTACAISPDGTLLAVAGTEPEIRLYSLPYGILAGTIPQVPGKTTALAFTSGGIAIAAGYSSGLLAFYSVQDRLLIRTLAVHNGAVTGISSLPGEESMVTSGDDGLVRVFRVPFLCPLAQADFETLAMVWSEEQVAGTGSSAASWRFLRRLLSLRFQNEIGICPGFRDAGIYDIQIVG